MKYLFFIEGLNREVWQVWQKGESEKIARKTVWNALSDEEQKCAVIECIDEQAN